MLSVIIPYYNAKPWLHACVNSITASLRLAGRLNEAEIVLVDDGSTDGASEEIPGVARTIRFPQNQGVAAARQAGLNAACGDWIAWVDADDCVREDWAETIFSCIKDEQAPDVLQFDAEAVRPDGTKFVISYRRPAGEIPVQIFHCDALKNVRTGSWLWNRVFRRELFDGISFDSDAGRGGKEDFMVMALVLAKAGKVEYVPKVIYEYRMHEGSLARFARGDEYLAQLKAIDEFVARLSPECVRKAAQFGAEIMFADYCRHEGVPHGARDRLARNFWRILFDGDTPVKEKLKYLHTMIFK